MSENPQPRSPQRKMQVEYPKDLDAMYVNLALISHTMSELFIDVAQLLPNLPKATVRQRLIMTPTNAKLLHRVLGENLAKFESTHGEIKIPSGSSLADQLFKHPPQADGVDSQGDDNG